MHGTKAAASEGREEKEKGKGKWREASGCYLLLLEQRELAVWVAASWSRVRKHDQADSQVLIMRVTRSPGASMSGQEVKSTGDGVQQGGHEGGEEGGEEKKQDQGKEQPKKEES